MVDLKAKVNLCGIFTCRKISFLKIPMGLQIGLDSIILTFPHLNINKEKSRIHLSIYDNKTLPLNDKIEFEFYQLESVRFLFTDATLFPGFSSFHVI